MAFIGYFIVGFMAIVLSIGIFVAVLEAIGELFIDKSRSEICIMIIGLAVSVYAVKCLGKFIVGLIN